MLYSTDFTYAVAENQHMYLAECLIQSVMESGVHLQNWILPPFINPEALHTFDNSLTGAFEAVELPEGWTFVGCTKDNAISEEGGIRVVCC